MAAKRCIRKRKCPVHTSVVDCFFFVLPRIKKLTYREEEGWIIRKMWSWKAATASIVSHKVIIVWCWKESLNYIGYRGREDVCDGYWYLWWCLLGIIISIAWARDSAGAYSSHLLFHIYKLHTKSQIVTRPVIIICTVYVSEVTL